MPPTTWTITDADGSVVRTGLTSPQARNALATLMRGGALSAASAAEAPAPKPAPAPQRVRVDERELVTA